LGTAGRNGKPHPGPGIHIEKTAISIVAELSIPVANPDHRKDRLRPQSAERDEFSRKNVPYLVRKSALRVCAVKFRPCWVDTEQSKSDCGSPSGQAFDFAALRKNNRRSFDSLRSLRMTDM
jgi:hypothetical protein